MSDEAVQSGVAGTSAAAVSGAVGVPGTSGTSRTATAGTIVLVTRLARAVFLRSSVDLVGMNLRNMVVLAYLRDHPSVSQQAMTEDLSMDSNTGVLVLNDLEDLEYAERRRDPADRRRHMVDITDAGLEALERAEVAQGSIEDEILGGLSGGERAELRRLLLKALEEHKA
jgi:DNA-binding MarR family transcriptional regulator